MMAHARGRCEPRARPRQHDSPDSWLESETLFVRERGASSEDDGYLVTIMSHMEGLRSKCWVFAAWQIGDPAGSSHGEATRAHSVRFRLAGPGVPRRVRDSSAR